MQQIHYDGTLTQDVPLRNELLRLALNSSLLQLVAVLRQPTGTHPSYGNNNNVYPRYGVVQSIDLVQINTNDVGASNVGVGTIAATVIGAAGGAYAGHALEKNAHQTTDAFKFTVLMEDHSYQTVTQATNGDIRVGDRVQLDNGVVRRN